jgi:archaellum biogenesis protein FlaJ (TadC family)
MAEKKEEIEMRMHRGKPKNQLKLQALIFSAAIILSLIVYFVSKNIIYASVLFFLVVVGTPIYLFASGKLKKDAEIRKMESVFPDFIELMSSNLRAGMTIDKALLISSRKEFAPLDREITILGKDIVTGKEITRALLEMAQRIKSEKIRKTIDVIISGIKSGGNISVLLEETAVNMRERMFLEKRAASNVLMYVIFIFFAVAVGAPVLFGLSSALVSIMTNILSTIPSTDVPINAPMTITKIAISTDFVNWFSIIFLVVSSFLASMILGLVSKGDEKSGLKYAVPLAVISVVIFLVIRTFMTHYFGNFFST